MVEIQDILREHGNDYRKQHKLPHSHHKAMKAMEQCRTAELGGHMDVCDECGVVNISYNSCRNRHCPKCQTLKREKWMDARKSDLLDVGYFHVVFTIPSEINTIVFQNQRELYSLLFRAASETLQELATNRKYLGARIGFAAILHTWGQNLIHHPHIHCVVPGGGLNEAGSWIKSRKKFFIPVKVMSRKFRGKFLALLREIPLEFHGSISELNDPVIWQRLLSTLYAKEWVVYCKSPFKNAACVVEYLGRYTHRVAISNNRILSCEDGMVTFRRRDYRDNNKQKVMTVTAEEFIRRFLIHILPDRFMKIRHYGLLANRDKGERLALCRRITRTQEPAERLTTDELLMKMLGRDIRICSHCGNGKMQTRYSISRSPPAA